MHFTDIIEAITIRSNAKKHLFYETYIKWHVKKSHARTVFRPGLLVENLSK